MIPATSRFVLVTVTAFLLTGCDREAASPPSKTYFVTYSVKDTNRWANSPKSLFSSKYDYDKNLIEKKMVIFSGYSPGNQAPFEWATLYSPTEHSKVLKLIENDPLFKADLIVAHIYPYMSEMAAPFSLHNGQEQKTAERADAPNSHAFGTFVTDPADAGSAPKASGSR